MLLAAAFFLTTIVGVTAEDLVFYSGGKAHRLIQSPTEFVVTLEAASVQRTWEAVQADPRYHMQPVPWAKERMEYGILQVGPSLTQSRDAMVALPGVETVRPVYRFEGSNSPMLSTGNLVVRLDDSLTAQERAQFFRDYRVAVVNVIDEGTHVYTVRPLGGARADEVRYAGAMYKDDRTLFAHPDFIVETTPKQVLGQIEDEFFNLQWHLNNTGQGDGTIGADISIAGAWAITFGEDVRLGIFDDSVDVQHEDLRGNYINYGHNPTLAEEGPLAPIPRNLGDRHGTSVMGLAAAAINDLGVRGVAPVAQFTASRGLNDVTSLGQIASAYTFARQQEVDVHINSWGFVGTSNSQVDVVVDAIMTSFREGRDGKGMVIVFAAGNDGVELGPDDDLGTLPEVIGIAATNANDILSGYSNYGADIDVAAPSNDFGLTENGMVTTDNTDDAGFSDIGYNDGSGQDLFGFPDLPDFRYTRNFGGTSAACPVAAGAAALVVSVNPNLTASQVRVVLEQTADKVNSLEADYHPITERSLLYGYGRINAERAVAASFESSRNGGFTWPDRLRSVRVIGSRIVWNVGDDIREIDEDDDGEVDETFGEVSAGTLVVESASPFAWTPTDGVDYTDRVGQDVTSGVKVAQDDASSSYGFENLGGTRYFALFPRNGIANYGFGVSVDSQGNVEGVGGSAGGGSVPLPPGLEKPRVSIKATPLSGESPLNVLFKGNALPTDPTNPIVSTTWDFGDGTTSNRATTTHRYEVSGDASQRFFATFTTTDEAGQTGSRTVAVDVAGQDASDGQGNGEDIRILISLRGSVSSDIERGESPLDVVLNIAGLLPPGTVTEVRWDLGDGSTANTLSVPHLYVNNGLQPQTLPISVRLAITTTSGTAVTLDATQFITIDPDPNAPLPEENGGTAEPEGTTTSERPATVPNALEMCGAGTGAAFVAMLALTLVWRRLR